MNGPGAQAIAARLNLPVGTVTQVIDFLLRTGLCKLENGSLTVGESQTFIGRDSPLLKRHHQNWRLKVLGQLETLREEELSFTNPITLSEKDFLKVRELLVRTIEDFRKIAIPSPPEELCCLNIDWVKIVASKS